MEKALESIKKELCGTWVLERSENVDAYLLEMGFGNCERKTYSSEISKTLIGMKDDTINIEMQFGLRKCQSSFKLNEEFMINAGRPSKALASWENGVLTMQVIRIDSGKTQIIKRRRDGNTMIQSMTCNGVTCRRFLKREPT